MTNSKNIKIETSVEENWLKIDVIKVDYEKRGQGIGTEALKNIIKKAKEQGYKGVYAVAFPESNDSDIVTGESIKNLMKWYFENGFEAYYTDYERLIEDDEEILFQNGITQGEYDYSIVEMEF